MITKKLVMLGFSLFVLTLFSCQKEILHLEPVPENNKIPTLSIVAENDYEKMFEDGESIHEMTSEDRRFKMAEIIQIKAINKDSIEIANFAPVDVKDIIIKMTKNDGTIVDLLNADIIGAHVIKRIGVSMNLGSESEVSQIKFDYEGNTSLVNKLKKLKAISWQVKPHDYDQDNNHQNWIDDPSPKMFRLAIGMLINSAYVTLEPEILEQMKLDTLVKNDGITIITNEEKEKDYNNLKSRKILNIGVVDPSHGTIGLGGYSIYGLTERLYKDSYSNINNEAAGHEFGHVMEYKHGSNMTYEREFGGRLHGFSMIFKRVWNNVIKSGELLIKPTEYYVPNDLL